MRKVLLIDGPQAGKVLATDSVVVRVIMPNDWADLSFEADDITYRVERIHLFGHSLFVGVSDQARKNQSAWEWLASGKAMEVEECQP